MTERLYTAKEELEKLLREWDYHPDFVKKRIVQDLISKLNLSPEEGKEEPICSYEYYDEDRMLTSDKFNSHHFRNGECIRCFTKETPPEKVGERECSCGMGADVIFHEGDCSFFSPTPKDQDGGRRKCDFCGNTLDASAFSWSPVANECNGCCAFRREKAKKTQDPNPSPNTEDWEKTFDKSFIAEGEGGEITRKDMLTFISKLLQKERAKERERIGEELQIQLEVQRKAGEVVVVGRKKVNEMLADKYIRQGKIEMLQDLLGIDPPEGGKENKDESICPECGEVYKTGEEARVDTGMKCGKCAYGIN